MKSFANLDKSLEGPTQKKKKKDSGEQTWESIQGGEKSVLG